MRQQITWMAYALCNSFSLPLQSASVSGATHLINFRGTVTVASLTLTMARSYHGKVSADNACSHQL